MLLLPILALLVEISAATNVSKNVRVINVIGPDDFDELFSIAIFNGCSIYNQDQTIFDLRSDPSIKSAEIVEDAMALLVNQNSIPLELTFCKLFAIGNIYNHFGCVNRMDKCMKSLFDEMNEQLITFTAPQLLNNDEMFCLGKLSAESLEQKTHILEHFMRTSFEKPQYHNYIVAFIAADKPTMALRVMDIHFKRCINRMSCKKRFISTYFQTRSRKGGFMYGYSLEHEAEYLAYKKRVYVNEEYNAELPQMNRELLALLCMKFELAFSKHFDEITSFDVLTQQSRNDILNTHIEQIKMHAFNVRFEKVPSFQKQVTQDVVSLERLTKPPLYLVSFRGQFAKLISIGYVYIHAHYSENFLLIISIEADHDMKLEIDLIIENIRSKSVVCAINPGRLISFEKSKPIDFTCPLHKSNLNNLEDFSVFYRLTEELR